jgi:hypothetical protein
MEGTPCVLHPCSSRLIYNFNSASIIRLAGSQIEKIQTTCTVQGKTVQDIE